MRKLKSSSGSFPMSKEEFAYMTLREAILSGELAAGQTLVQTEIAEDLGISAIPVRAAMRRLIAEGLVTQETHHPPRVASISVQSLGEILLIRMHLETLATKEAVPYIQQETLDELKALVQQMERALQDDDMPSFGALNKLFHMTIYEVCPYPLLLKMIRDLWDNSDRYRSRTMFAMVPGLANLSHQDHQELLRLIEAHDADGAAAVMEKHKKRSRERFLNTIRQDS